MPLLQDPEKHWAEIRDQPDEPNRHAEAVETQDEAFILAEQYDGCPHGVNEHENDRQHTGETMHVVDESASRFEHQRRPPCIADDAEPKEDQVP